MIDRTCIFITSKKLFRFRQKLNKNIGDIVPCHVRLQLFDVIQINMNIYQLRSIKMLDKPIYILWQT